MLPYISATTREMLFKYAHQSSMKLKNRRDHISSVARRPSSRLCLDSVLGNRRVVIIWIFNASIIYLKYVCLRFCRVVSHPTQAVYKKL